MAYLLTNDPFLFPKTSLADEDGLLAVGGDLQIERLQFAYRHGIFPWYNDDTPILWYAPHQRCVIFPQRIKVSKSMQQLIRKNRYQITVNQAFSDVLTACAQIERKEQTGTWLNPSLQNALIQLNKLGQSISVEVWNEKKLVGGLYGVVVGKIFCGESMFSKESNTSKLALIYLCHQLNFKLVDCQIPNEHLISLGAEMMDRETFESYLYHQ
jgi:leucyl/phenylalanyl-tRNA--protein transferase